MFHMMFIGFRALLCVVLVCKAERSSFNWLSVLEVVLLVEVLVSVKSLLELSEAT